MAWTEPPPTFTIGDTTGTTARLNQFRDNIKEVWRELAYVPFTSVVTASGANTEAAPLDIVSSGAITYVANPIVIIVSAPGVLLTSSSTGNAGISLWDGATDLGRLMMNDSAAAFELRAGLYAERRLTPTAASHTYKARLWIGAGATAGVVKAGAGGAGVTMPGFIRVLQKGSA